MSINIIERAVTPYNEPMSRLVQRERYNLFVPMAGLNSIGMAGYTPTDFAVINGIVYIANGSITTDKLASSSVTAPKIASNSVTTDKLQDNAITTEKIADEAVTPEKLSFLSNDEGSGVGISTNGLLELVPASRSIIDNAYNQKSAVGVAEFAYAVKKALTNPTERSMSDVVPLEWTDDEKFKAIKTLGIDTYVQQVFNTPNAEGVEF